MTEPVFRIYVYPCGCSVGRDESFERVTSVGVCVEHAPEVSAEIGYLGRFVSGLGRQSGEPSCLDSQKLATTLEEVIRAEMAQGGEADGSA